MCLEWIYSVTFSAVLTWSAWRCWMLMMHVASQSALRYLEMIQAQHRHLHWRQGIKVLEKRMCLPVPGIKLLPYPL